VGQAGAGLTTAATTCATWRRREFEEVAYLLLHGKLPTKAELAAYKRKLKACATCRKR
jgi:2-methylcitrate synthase